MSIQVSGTTVIDNSRNVTNVQTVTASTVTASTVTATSLNATTYQIQNLPTLP